LQVFDDLSYADISDLAEKELKISTASSKGEEGDLWLGRILFYGAIIRSSVFNRVNKAEQTEVITGLIEAHNKRSYLPSLAAPFLVHLILDLPEDKFSKVLWPALKPLLAKEWPQQTQHTLYLLLHIYKK
jgi:DNA polymerase phi